MNQADKDNRTRPKQVIVVRKDLRTAGGEPLRRGKEIAQGAHAAMVWLSKRARESWRTGVPVTLTAAEAEWLTGMFTKIVTQADDETDLHRVLDRADRAGVSAHAVHDSGLTEFGGVRTMTAVAVGPDYPDVVDLVTGGMRLY